MLVRFLLNDHQPLNSYILPSLPVSGLLSSSFSTGFFSLFASVYHKESTVVNASTVHRIRHLKEQLSQYVLKDGKVFSVTRDQNVF